MADATVDWKAEARELREAGLSEREIAEQVGRAASSVHEAVKDVEPLSPGPAPLASSNGHGGAERVPEATPGQQTIDGREVPADGQAPVEEIRVDGTVQLGMFDAGGKRPQSSSLRLVGGKVGLVDGKAFRKGDVIHFEGTAIVDEIGQKDKADSKTGIVVSAEQKHAARITDLRVTGAES